MHFLDLIMYVVVGIIIWYTMAWLSGGDLTEEIGGLIGMMIMIVYTIIYCVLFIFFYDWVDIFEAIITWSPTMQNIFKW